MTTTITILGCGSSGGVPRIGNIWGDCDPSNPRNRRQRCSILVQRRNGQGDETNVLVDTTPDMRNQLNKTTVKHLDAVLYTHGHADHVHGIDDLRAVAIANQSRVNVWADQPTSNMLMKRFGYCFKTPVGSEYPPILNLHLLEVGKMMEIDGPGGMVNVLPFSVNHGGINSLGFRFNDTAYTPDISDIPPESLDAVTGLDCWIIDGLRYKTHPSHFTLGDALGWVERVRPSKAVITNMHIDLDYERVQRETPEHVSPAYGGLVIEI